MGISNELSLNEARRIVIKTQLLSSSGLLERKTLLQIIEQLGFVQIDTISVIERSHHHILWSRMADYKKPMLDDLLEKEKSIFEYWSHAASYLPMKDFRYSLIRKRNYSQKYKSWKRNNKKILNYVYDRIRDEGPLLSKNFKDYRRQSTGWWDWKPSKDALDFLFHEGKLMVAKRKGFQKVYDITERVLPEGANTEVPTEEEYYKHLILSSIRSNGLVTQKEMTYLRKYNLKLFMKIICELLEDNVIVSLKLQESNEESYYTFEQTLKILEGQNNILDVHALSPFDNLLIQRARMRKLFNFDYQLECYLPEARRKHGYFCLPVLIGDKFIGKIDAKASRENKTFILKKFIQEEGVSLNKIKKQKLLRKIQKLSRFTQCDNVVGINFLNHSNTQ